MAWTTQAGGLWAVDCGQARVQQPARRSQVAAPAALSVQCSLHRPASSVLWCPPHGPRGHLIKARPLRPLPHRTSFFARSSCQSSRHFNLRASIRAAVLPHLDPSSHHGFAYLSPRRRVALCTSTTPPLSRRFRARPRPRPSSPLLVAGCCCCYHCCHPPRRPPTRLALCARRRARHAITRNSLSSRIRALDPNADTYPSPCSGPSHLPRHPSGNPNHHHLLHRYQRQLA